MTTTREERDRRAGAPLHPMVLAEQTACVRYLRAAAADLQGQYAAAPAKTHTRARLLGAIEALKSAAVAIENGADEAHFGEGE